MNKNQSINEYYDDELISARPLNRQGRSIWVGSIPKNVRNSNLKQVLQRNCNIGTVEAMYRQNNHEWAFCTLSCLNAAAELVSKDIYINEIKLNIQFKKKKKINENRDNSPILSTLIHQNCNLIKSSLSKGESEKYIELPSKPICDNRTLKNDSTLTTDERDDNKTKIINGVSTQNFRWNNTMEYKFQDLILQKDILKNIISLLIQSSQLKYSNKNQDIGFEELYRFV